MDRGLLKASVICAMSLSPLLSFKMGEGNDKAMANPKFLPSLAAISSGGLEAGAPRSKGNVGQKRKAGERNERGDTPPPYT